MIGTVNVRIIDARITVTCADGTVFTGSYRLVTILTDARRHPADALAGLYHQRWEQSGSRDTSPCPGPLRTVLATFTAHGSSRTLWALVLSPGLLVIGLVVLPVTVCVYELEVLPFIPAPVPPVDEMMLV